MSKTFFLALALTLPAALWAQESATTTIAFDHVALSVADLDASAEFYEAVFDLKEITNRGKTEGIRWFSLGEGKELHLISVVKEPVQLNKAVHFALKAADFDGFLATLKAMDVEFSNFPGTVGEVSVRADGIRQLYLQDPDGYWIEVNSVASN
jgi:catechol 2,3-dioxygenase-like lactoylglutathione lyase family enzyme